MQRKLEGGNSIHADTTAQMAIECLLPTAPNSPTRPVAVVQLGVSSGSNAVRSPVIRGHIRKSRSSSFPDIAALLRQRDRDADDRAQGTADIARHRRAATRGYCCGRARPARTVSNANGMSAAQVRGRDADRSATFIGTDRRRKAVGGNGSSNASPLTKLNFWARSFRREAPTLWRFIPHGEIRIHLAIPGGRRKGVRDGLRYCRQCPQVRNQRPDVLLVPIGRVVPGHPLPVERAAVLRNSTSNRPRYLVVGPISKSEFAIRRQVLSPTTSRKDAS